MLPTMDSTRRALERTASEDPQARAAWLAARVRAGAVAVERVWLAADLGDQAARFVARGLPARAYRVARGWPRVWFRRTVQARLRLLAPDDPARLGWASLAGELVGQPGRHAVRALRAAVEEWSGRQVIVDLSGVRTVADAHEDLVLWAAVLGQGGGRLALVRAAPAVERTLARGGALLGEGSGRAPLARLARPAALTDALLGGAAADGVTAALDAACEPLTA
jgi:hypothetical protein